MLRRFFLIIATIIIFISLNLLNIFHKNFSFAQRNYKTIKELVYTIPEGYKRIVWLVLSPDKKRWAMLLKRNNDNKFILVVDGKNHIEYNKNPFSGLFDGREYILYEPPPYFQFSPDSKSFAYRYSTESKDKYFIIWDNLKFEAYDDILDFVFSPNSKHIAYSVYETKTKKYFVVLNNQEGKRYDWVSQLTFSPDSKQLAYTAREGDNWFVVLNDKESQKYDGISELKFSSDGTKLAYVAREGDNWFVVVDGKRGKNYQKIEEIYFSPNNQNIAYIAGENCDKYLSCSKKFVVFNNRESKRYDWISEIKFSPDSKKLAYVAIDGNKIMLVVNNKEVKSYYYYGNPGYIDYLNFSPITNDFDFVKIFKQSSFTDIDNTDNPLSYEGEKSIITLNNEIIGEYKSNCCSIYMDITGILFLTFAPNGKYIIYVVDESKLNETLNDFIVQQSIVIFEKTTKKKIKLSYKGEILNKPSFSEDNKYLIYFVQEGNNIYKTTISLN